MSRRIKVATLAFAAVLVVAATTYVFTAPYTRIAGVRIGGTLTPPPADFLLAFKERTTGILKLAGFPPFVVHVALMPFKEGFITATRPDGGYWAQRVRMNPNGWLRYGDATFAMKAKEIVGEEKLPYLQAWGGDLNRRRSGGIIIGVSEPLREWECFLWTPR